MPSEHSHPLPAAVTVIGDHAWIAVPDYVDLGNAVDVGDRLIESIGGGVTSVVIDLTLTRLCAAAGVSALVGAIKHADRLAVDLDILVANGSFVDRTLTICGIPHRCQQAPDLAGW